MFYQRLYFQKCIRQGSQRGQIGVILLLMMVVMLTIALSLVARTTRELKVSTQEVESTQVLNAAETGLDRYLAMDLTTLSYPSGVFTDVPTLLQAGSDFRYQVAITQNSNLDVLNLKQGAAAEVNLQGANGLVIWWATEGCGPDQRASLVVTIYGESGGVKTAQHTAHAGCNPNGRGDGIAGISASSTGGIDPTGAGLQRQVTISPLPAGATIARIRPVYAETRLHAEVTGATSVQGHTIKSVGTSLRGNETRVVEVNQTLPIAPSVLDFVLFSGTSLVK